MSGRGGLHAANMSEVSSLLESDPYVLIKMGNNHIPLLIVRRTILVKEAFHEAGMVDWKLHMPSRSFCEFWSNLSSPTLAYSHEGLFPASIIRFNHGGYDFFPYL